jgi:predicted ABC-type ATPase
MTKWLWIVAGPNGAGKSTHTAKLIVDLEASGFIGADIIKLNADERTAELRKQFPDRPLRELNLQAAQETDAALVKHIAEDAPYIVVETVLSSTKYQDDVLEARERGYNVGLTYVSVHPPELILGRIINRVAKGGHNVDAQKALDRYRRSHENLVWFARHSDRLFILDNSAPREIGPVLVATKEVGKRLIWKRKAWGINPALDHAIRALQRGDPYYPSPNAG